MCWKKDLSGTNSKPPIKNPQHRSNKVLGPSSALLFCPWFNVPSLYIILIKNRVLHWMNISLVGDTEYIWAFRAALRSRVLSMSTATMRSTSEVFWEMDWVSFLANAMDFPPITFLVVWLFVLTSVLISVRRHSLPLIQSSIVKCHHPYRFKIDVININLFWYLYKK